jgi:hypothetical protein
MLGAQTYRQRIRHRGSSPAALEVRRELTLQEYGRGGYGPYAHLARGPSGFRFNALRTSYVLTTRRTIPVELGPQDRGAGSQGAINAAYRQGLVGKHETVINPDSRIRIRSANRRTNEIVRNARSADIRASGKYVVYAGTISASSSPGNKTTLIIPGMRVNLNLGGYAGNLQAPYLDINNPNFRNSAITITGHGMPLVHGAQTGNMMLNSKSFGGLSEAAARDALHHATNIVFDPTHGVPDFSMPSRSALQHAATSHIVLGSAPATFNHLSERAAAHFAHEMRAGYGEHYVSRKNRKWDVDAPTPH